MAFSLDSMALAISSSPLDQLVIKELASQMKPVFAILTISAGFSAMLVPMLVVLFGFSSPQARRKPIFILVVCDVMLGLAFGAWTMKRSVRWLRIYL
jgi:hypothetical protein